MSNFLSSSQRPQSFHPDFDRDVRMMVLSIEGQGFKVDAARLCAHSNFLDNMLGDRDGHLGSSQEGSIDNPIIITGCSASAFANFLKWLNHDSWSPLVANHIQQLLDILHICHMWEILPGVEFASRQLRSFELRVAHQFDIANRYQLGDWIPDIVRSLLATPLETYTEDDLAKIGFPVYVVIASAKEALACERRRLGNHAPLPRSFDNAPFCESPDTCKRVWCEKWFSILVRRIHHISNPLPLSQIPDVLEKIDHDGMHRTCKGWLIDWIKQSDSLQREESLIQEAIASVHTQLM